MKNPGRRKNILALFLIPALMFGFGYLMVPIYNVFCDWTGLNGKTGEMSASEAVLLKADTSRSIRVEFTASLNDGTPLDFTPSAPSMNAHPGRTYRATYTARNLKGEAMTGQAVPSVSPAKAAGFFNKTECFCFTRQEFAAGEQRELPLVFVIEPDLPPDIDTITLAYTFFDVDAPPEKSADGHASAH
ncbi:MAG: cytochrome c oxidase assembly protein [Gammaproteobacteria bacterium]|nr:cytochrome c oxidase assembly protein [Gammaproteobacteria bacterium]CAJ2376826.1 MAG: Cytochrome c oxidase assembly protein CtaG [Arenicellales bacterium IbO2]MDA7961300.1 cytochrome c oxidase assembly protein [Gammaproteobacteria bacterium]MDA7969342.1 cytochrome c oxidase assembly protein [Gammaproteobacteria bacterium]MDA7971500.1 cytochrome c oxidase assembly protein [Gammaproteobacteria bacterium]